VGRAPVGSALTGRAEFVSAAQEFCRLYEHAGELDAERLLVGLERALPRLQTAGFELSFSGDDDELPEDDPDLRLTTEERQAADRPVQALFGMLDWSDAEARLDRPVGGALLLDDLSDIYADLKEGFRLLEAGRSEVEADFVWYQGFWSHWGYHCASAIGVVHHYVALYFGPL
jgi:Domain of unknown function (DUF5063)